MGAMNGAFTGVKETPMVMVKFVGAGFVLLTAGLTAPLWLPLGCALLAAADKQNRAEAFLKAKGAVGEAAENAQKDLDRISRALAEEVKVVITEKTQSA